jgi:alkylhydroperoxidase family enzyme
MTPRITPLEPPYSTELQAGFDKVMRGQPPSLLFRTVATNPRVLQRMMAGGLLDRGSVSLRLRELMILRTTAMCGSEYEWGVHGGPEDACWNDEERLVIGRADQFHVTATVDEGLWADLSGNFTDEQLIELIMLAGLYHAVSFMTNATGVQHESFAPRFPSKTAGEDVRDDRN